MSELYIKVGEYENDPDPIELPIEKDDSISLSSITAQFPGASGLKYRNPSSQTIRGLKMVEGVLYLPSQNEDWENYVYFVVNPKDNKRKMEDEDSSYRRSKRPAQKCTDLIVLGLPWKITEDGLKNYFSEFGDLTVNLIKRDSQGKSKGYGFIRYASYESQEAVLSKRHIIEGRFCDVKIPHSQEPVMSSKIFVGRVTETMSKEDLRKHFEQFGEVLDVYIPTPFRAFAFVTFKDSSVAQSLVGEEQIVNGASVYINTANPKSNNNNNVRDQMSAMTSAFAAHNPSAALYGMPGLSHHHNDGANSAGGAGSYNNVNPAMLAAAWGTMMTSILRSGNVDPMGVMAAQNKGGNVAGSGRGDGSSATEWRNPSDASHWNIK